MDGKCYSTLEAAKALGVSDWTIRERIKSGELKAYRAGRSYVITQADLDTYKRRSKSLLSKRQRTAIRKILDQESSILECDPSLLDALHTLKEML